MIKTIKIIFKKIITRLTILKHHCKIIKIPKYQTNDSKDIRIAIQFHIFFIDLLDEVHLYLNNILLPFDLFISTNNREKKDVINNYFENHKLNSVNNISVEVLENRGRDIYPFFKQMTPIYNNYEIIGHFHTKKSTTSQIGNRWRSYLYNTLLNKNYVNELLNYMHKNMKIGIIAPAPYYEIIINYYDNLKNKYNIKNVSDFLRKLNIFNKKIDKSTQYPAGNMFFIRTDAVRKLFDLNLTLNDFPNEEGQVDNTTQHTIELIWKFIVEDNRYIYKELV